MGKNYFLLKMGWGKNYRFLGSIYTPVVSCFQGCFIFAKDQTKVNEVLQQTCHPPGLKL